MRLQRIVIVIVIVCVIVCVIVFALISGVFRASVEIFRAMVAEAGVEFFKADTAILVGVKACEDGGDALCGKFLKMGDCGEFFEG